MNRVLVVCIGNDLVADDGAGQAVYNSLLASALPENVRLVCLGLGGIDLLEEIDGEELLIVVDSVQLGGLCGTIHRLEWDQLPPVTARPVSGHGIGVREAIVVAKRLYPDRTPARTCLIGIEGKCFNQLGVGLTAEVRKAVPEAVKMVQALIAAVR